MRLTRLAAITAAAASLAISLAGAPAQAQNSPVSTPAAAATRVWVPFVVVGAIACPNASTVAITLQPSPVSHLTQARVALFADGRHPWTAILTGRKTIILLHTQQASFWQTVPAGRGFDYDVVTPISGWGCRAWRSRH